MSLKPPTPGTPGFKEWKDLADAVDAAGVLGAATHTHSDYADGFDAGREQAYAECVMVALQWAAAREPEYGGQALSNLAEELQRRGSTVPDGGSGAASTVQGRPL